MRRPRRLEALSFILPSAAPVRDERPVLIALPQGNVARSVRQPRCSHLAARRTVRCVAGRVFRALKKRRKLRRLTFVVGRDGFEPPTL